jgi:hypothetical protein
LVLEGLAEAHEPAVDICTAKLRNAAGETLVFPISKRTVSLPPSVASDADLTIATPRKASELRRQ